LDREGGERMEKEKTHESTISIRNSVRMERERIGEREGEETHG
jgi:hypothetical protein